MFLTIRKQNRAISNRLFLMFVVVSFVGNSILPGYAIAQTALNLPAVGTRVNVSEPFKPALLKGLKLDVHNPLKFNFIIDTGHSKLSGEELKLESNKLIRYFLSALTVPDQDLWVNLSPVEKDRIIADGLVKTEMGRDMLAQDYLLKQITASLVYPEGELGKKFWAKVRLMAQERFGTTEISVDTFNKVWIVPQNAVIYESNGTAIVVENHLKVMLEEDYLALDNSMIQGGQVTEGDANSKEVNALGSQIVREIVLPELEKDVNTGKNFANLRQIANAVVLAWWYKQNLKESLLGKVYVDQNKVHGIDLAEKDSKLKIYNQYLEALKAGVYNYIKEDIDPATHEVLPRKYFSGGTALNYDEANAQVIRGALPADQGAQVADALTTAGSFVQVESIAVENSRLVPVSVPQNYDTVLQPMGLRTKSVEAISLRGNNPEEVVSNNQTLTVLRTSLAQAIGAILFAGTGKDGKVAADANAVELTLRTILDFINANPKDAIVIRADEGARDESVSLIRGRIYYQGYTNGYADFDSNHPAYEAELNRLAAAGVKLHYFAGDALEKTNGLAQIEALTSATDSWALASLADDTSGYRLLVDDNARIAGLSFNAPTDAGVEPFDLPSVAIAKIARARGIEVDTPAYTAFVNRVTFVTLGPREAEYVKSGTQSDNHRHKEIIDDAIELKKKFPGFELRTPGDGDFAPRVVSSLGIDLDGRLMITGGRSGSAEATIARLVTALVPGAQFNNRFVSEKATSSSMILANADQYTETELASFRTLGYPSEAHTRTNLASELEGKGSVAVTSVTGASEWLFGKSFANMMPRVTINKEDGTVTTHTLVVTPTGNVYVIRSTFTSDDFAKTLQAVVIASPEARDYVAKNGEAFLSNLRSGSEQEVSTGSVIPDGSRETNLEDTGVKISFGTSGWRGRNGSDFVLPNILRAAQGTASYVLESGKKKVIVGYDTREGNPTFSQETAAVLAANGIQVIYVNAAATPTPALALLAQQMAETDADFGGVINFTASHSPAQDNGFKFSPAHGGAADKAITDRITALANGAATYRTMDYDQAKAIGLVVEMDTAQVVQTYKDYTVGVLKATTDKEGVSAWDTIVNYFKTNPSKRIVLDPMQGTAVEYLRAIYSEIAQSVGREDLITIINTNNADSKFLDVNGRPQPDAKASHKNLLDEVNKNQGNALGISTDGDADRFGFIDFNGKFTSADDLIGLLAYFLKGEVGLDGAIGKTVVTSDFSNRVAEHLNSEIDELPVGFKNFVEQVVKSNRKYVVAGEESAHVMVGPFAKTWDDGIAVGLTVLWMVARSGKSLGEYKENVEKILDVRYLTSVDTIRDDVRGEEMKRELGVKITSVKDALAGRPFTSLSPAEQAAVPFVSLVESETGMKVQDIVLKDGMKFVISGGSLSMRPSGTEPAVKVYVQSKQTLSTDQAGAVAERNREVLKGVGKTVLDAQSTPAVPAQELTVREESGDDVALGAAERWRPAVDRILETQIPQMLSEMDAAYGKTDASDLAENPFAEIGFDGKANRLGWGVQGLRTINENPTMLDQTITDARDIAANYKYVIFSGMGGSGLSEQFVQSTFGEPAGIKMYSLRTTDPAVIAAIIADIVAREGGDLASALEKTKIIVSSKSGTTKETNTHKDHFEALFKLQGVDTAGHFMLVTDPGSPMEAEAKAKGYDLRYIQLNKGTDIGGRFTAPTTNIFLLPLAMVTPEAKVREILRRAQEMNERSNISEDAFLQLGTFLYYMASQEKRDKVTLMVPESMRDLGLWAEQLFEESLGKSGKGVTLFYGEQLSPEQLREADQNDRVFVRFNVGGETNPSFAQYLKENGYPVFDVNLNNIDEIGGLTLGLERTVAAIAYLWNINFVNQPGVEGYKEGTRQVLSGLKAGEQVPVPANWQGAAYKSLKVYFTPFFASGIATEEQLAAEVARMGRSMDDGAAVYAAMINLSLGNQTKSTFEVSEFASFGQMTPAFRQALEEFRSLLFTNQLQMPAKIGEAPDKLHSYQQNIADGKNMFFSTYFMPEQSDQPAGLDYDVNNLRAPTIGTVLSLMNVNRKVTLITFAGRVADSEADAKAFFDEVRGLLETTAPVTPTVVNPGGINLNPKFFNLQIKRDGLGVPLPMYDQPIDMKIDGFVPVIINITPLDVSPLLDGAVSRREVREKLSYNLQN